MSKMEDMKEKTEARKREAEKLKKHFGDIKNTEAFKAILDFCEINTDYLIAQSMHLTEHEAKAKCVDNAGGVKMVQEYLKRMTEE